MSKKIEGVPSDHEDESESEEENEELPQNAVSGDWAAADYGKLVEQLRAVLPRKDSKKPQNTLSKIPWDKVAFEGHTAEDVKATTVALVAKIRKYRTLTEMLEDIVETVTKINSAGKPKQSPSAYNLFTKDKFPILKAKFPEATSAELLKMVSQEFSILSERKKHKYETLAATLKEKYKQHRDNPNAVPVDKKEKKKKSARTPKAKAITPYGLFREEKRQEMEEITNVALRKLWDDLDMKKKLKYIQQAFQSQSDNIKLKLTKGEQSMLEVASGKPESIPRTTAEYYLKHYAEPAPMYSLNEWRKIRLQEYKALPKVRKLQLEIEYRQAKQDYVVKYQEYITNIKDEAAKHAEIELLRSFITSKLDKEERRHLDDRPFHTLVESMALPPSESVPIAESTTLFIEPPKKTKKSSKKAAAEAVEKEVASPIAKPIKSILKGSPASKRLLQEEPNAVEAAPSPSKKKKKASRTESESDSNSERRDKKPIVVPEVVATPTKKDSSKAGSKENGTPKPAPQRPPATMLEYYQKYHYLGKKEKCKESFKNLSALKKQQIKDEMRAAQDAYLKQLQKFLKKVPQENVVQQLKALKKAEKRYSRMKEDETSDEEEESATFEETVPKAEPISSSSSSDSSSSTEEEEEEQERSKNANGHTKNDNDNEGDDGDDDSSDDE
uniref:HMG box domain-containing protein n=1 Tax=Anopheles epiroticus TaxID=199890 RepID=A0A182P898_9DIPT